MDDLIYRYRNILSFVYIGISVFLLMTLDSTFNGGFNYSIRILCVPLAVIIFGYTWLNRRFLYRVNNNKVITWVVAILIYVLSLGMTWPYVMAINAFTGNGEKIIYAGPIERKWSSKGRYYWSYHIGIRNENTSEIVTLNCSKKFYDSVSEGVYISDQYYMGGLGLPYRWKISSNK